MRNPLSWLAVCIVSNATISEKRSHLQRVTRACIIASGSLLEESVACLLRITLATWS